LPVLYLFSFCDKKQADRIMQQGIEMMSLTIETTHSAVLLEPGLLLQRRLPPVHLLQHVLPAELQVLGLGDLQFQPLQDHSTLSICSSGHTSTPCQSYAHAHITPPTAPYHTAVHGVEHHDGSVVLGQTRAAADLLELLVLLHDEFSHPALLEVLQPHHLRLHLHAWTMMHRSVELRRA
jgi:hypothetical protein